MRAGSSETITAWQGFFLKKKCCLKRTIETNGKPPQTDNGESLAIAVTLRLINQNACTKLWDSTKYAPATTNLAPMNKQRHQNLDLTKALFAPIWWGRAAMLCALFMALVVLIALRPSMQDELTALEQITPQIELQLPSGATGEAQVATDIASADIAAAYDSLLAITLPASDYSAEHGHITAVTLKERETLGEALMRAGTSAAQAFSSLKELDKVHRVKSVRPGLVIWLEQSAADIGPKLDLRRLYFKATFQSIAQVTRDADGRYVAEAIALRTTSRMYAARGQIDASLYIAAEREGVPAATIISLIRALSYRVDFQREIRAGDQFAALYSMQAAADGSLAPGDIDYAELDLGDRVEKLYRFQNPATKRYDYFDAKGESMRRLLMRTPIDGARLTSSFGKRKHPVLGYVRSHQGVDFGASTGTPIYAAGDGVVERSNRFGSYGNYVLIRHPRGYKTAYAHLSKFARGMRVGKSVRQGDVIGYVGATGRVTGAHLHYEVYKNGVRVNPMRLDLPTGEVLGGNALAAFKGHLRAIEEILESETAAR